MKLELTRLQTPFRYAANDHDYALSFATRLRAVSPKIPTGKIQQIVEGHTGMRVHGCALLKNANPQNDAHFSEDEVQVLQEWRMTIEVS